MPLQLNCKKSALGVGWRVGAGGHGLRGRGRGARRG